MRKQISLYPETKSHDLTDGQKQELLALCAKLKALTGGAAACADAMDQLGYLRSAMDPHIKPYFPDKGRLVGLAYTIRGANVAGLPKGIKEVRETVDVEYFDNIQPGYVLTYGTGVGDRGCLVGDVLSTIATSHGAVGSVTDGPIRDLERIRPLNFLPFGPPASPISGEGRHLFIEYNCIVQVGGIWVEPFDILYGDMDGVVVIPKHLAPKVLELASALCDKEDAIKESFMKYPGKKMVEIFEMHGRRP